MSSFSEMDKANSTGSDGEFFDCLSNDFDKARSAWKQLKGSRMKVFGDFQDAKQFAQTPVESLTPNVVSYPNGKLLELRRFIDDNPLTLVTKSDTPTLLQIRLRYNALHVAASNNVIGSLACILEYLNSSDFWCRIYPNVSKLESRSRQKHVIDLYLNSPELGNYETPLHCASKFGHVECARLLATHPLTLLESVNKEDKTPAQVACSRHAVSKRDGDGDNLDQTRQQSVTSTSLSRVFDQSFVVLADLATTSRTATSKVSILGPVKLHDLQELLAKLYRREFPGLKPLLPHYHWLLSSVDSTVGQSPTVSSVGTDNKVLHVRAFAGPMLTAEAIRFRSKWLQANSSANWKMFAALRLTDEEKGYERQGRYFSRCFQSDWYEYWGFLDDFLDFSSEKGLSQLEEHLSTDSSLLEFPKDNDPPGTPILRQFPSRTQSTPVAKPDNGFWNTYRSTSAITNMLNDTLDESSQSSHKLASDCTDDEIRGSPVRRSLMSPIVNKLKRLIVASPLGYVFSDRPCSSRPVFSEKQTCQPKCKRSFQATNNGSVPSADGHVVQGDTDGVVHEPATKKSSPLKPALTRGHRGLPAIVGHVYRALPACDTELDKAVNSVADYSSEAQSQLPLLTPRGLRDHPDSSPPTDAKCPNPPVNADLSSFERIRMWKTEIQPLI